MEPENWNVFRIDNGDMPASYVTSPEGTTLPVVGGRFLLVRTPKRLMERKNLEIDVVYRKVMPFFGCQTKYDQIWKFILIIILHSKNDEKL